MMVGLVFSKARLLVVVKMRQHFDYREALVLIGKLPLDNLTGVTET